MKWSCHCAAQAVCPVEYSLDGSWAAGCVFFLWLLNLSAVLKAKDKREGVQAEAISVITVSGEFLIVPHK